MNSVNEPNPALPLMIYRVYVNQGEIFEVLAKSRNHAMNLVQKLLADLDLMRELSSSDVITVLENDPALRKSNRRKKKGNNSNGF